MSNGVSQHRDAAHAGDPVLEIPDHSAGELLIDRLRKNLTSVKIRDAGNYNDQTRNLVLQYLELMKLDEQDAIIGQMDEIGKLEKKLENNRSPFRKLFLVRDFKRVSKETYLIVKKLSNRIIDDQIKGRHRAATDPQGWPTFPHGPAPRPNGGSFTAPVFPVATAVDPSVNSFGNAFTNPQVASALAAAACSNLGRVELTKFESRTTGDPAVHLRLHDRDERVRDYLATLSSAWAPPEHRSDEQEETSTIHSSEIFSEPGIYA